MNESKPQQEENIDAPQAAEAVTAEAAPSTPTKVRRRANKAPNSPRKLAKREKAKSGGKDADAVPKSDLEKYAAVAKELYISYGRPFLSRYYLAVLTVICISSVVLLHFKAASMLKMKEQKNPLDDFTDRVNFQIMVSKEGSESLHGELDIGLFGKLCPKTVQNFIMMSRDEDNGYCYTSFEKFLPGGRMIGGRTVSNENTFIEDKEDLASEGIRIPYFPGAVYSIDTEDNVVGSFGIVSKESRELKGKVPVFGRIVDGWEFLQEINKEVEIDETGKPSHNIFISHVRHRTQQEWLLDVGLKQMMAEMDDETRASLQLMAQNLKDEMNSQEVKNKEADGDIEEEIKEDENKETKEDTDVALEEEIKEKKDTEETKEEIKEEIQEVNIKETEGEAGSNGE